jgi:hypothetical protein
MRIKCKAKCNEGTKEQERARIIASFTVLHIPFREQCEIIEALDSHLWDWYNDCDGCTLVSEAYWPNRFFPPCLRHDFDFLTGNKGMEANNRFYRIQRAYRMSRVRSAGRWLGVTIGWFGWFKWRNMARGK